MGVETSFDFSKDSVKTSFQLPGLKLKPSELTDFFSVESKSRQVSPAERLGIDPIVAGKIVAAYNGKLHFEPDESKTLTLELKTVASG